MQIMRVLTCLLAASLFVFAADDAIDFARARELAQRRNRGETLTAEEQQYLQRAIALRRSQQAQGQLPGQPPPNAQAPAPKAKIGLIPLCDLQANDRYKGEDGGLYGGGRNEPPAELATAARKELARIAPLDAEGKPSPDGKVVLLSIGMSNTTQEYSEFMRLAGRDPLRNPKLVIVDGAAGGMDVLAWAESKSFPRVGGTPWDNAANRLKESGVSPKQVQVVWLKQAKMGPAGWGEFPAHARKLADGMATILQMAKARYPNLRVAYLSSRIYAGYASTQLNPEPYSYESAFSVRWLIQEQMKGDKKLNWDAAKGEVKSPLLLWGPYLWADGVAGRKADKLIWNQDDLANDGTHPSPKSGTTKVAQLLLQFFQENPLASSWYKAKP